MKKTLQVLGTVARAVIWVLDTLALSVMFLLIILSTGIFLSALADEPLSVRQLFFAGAFITFARFAILYVAVARRARKARKDRDEWLRRLEHTANWPVRD